MLTLHGQELKVNEEVEREECARGSSETRHEIDDNVEEEESDSRERDIRQGVCEGQCSGTEELVTSLL